MTTRFTITVDGDTVEVVAGQSVAAALTAADLKTLRRTRDRHRPRGVFCGIGACFDCLVTLNGRPDVRACLVTAEPGDQITTGDTHDL